MNYRREIGGLKAIALAQVNLFHSRIETFSGGFVGVHVFVAISGYLITSVILTEHVGSRLDLVELLCGSQNQNVGFALLWNRPPVSLAKGYSA